jgi:cysteine-rich repeat protein
MSRPLSLATCSVMLLLASFAVAVAAPPNDECTSATAMSAPPFSMSVALTGATDGDSDPIRSCTGQVGHHNVWFTFTATAGGPLSVVSPAQLTLYTGACGALVEVACSASDSLSVGIAAGTTYVLEVSGAAATYPVTATLCGNGTVDGPPEACDDGNLVNGDGCDDHCRLECPNDICACLRAASQFDAVGDKTSVKSGKLYGEVVASELGGSLCGRTAKLRGKFFAESAIDGDVILTTVVGRTAATFKGYAFGGVPYPGVLVGGDVATGGGILKNLQYAQIAGVTDTSGAYPGVATCQEARGGLASASAMLSALAPTQVLGALVVEPGDIATIGVGPGREVVNVESITLKGNAEDWAELDVVLDPATDMLVINVAKSLRIGVGAALFVDGDAPVIVNLLPRATVKMGKEAQLGAPLLAPTAKIGIPDGAWSDALYTTKAVNLRGAVVASSMDCP